MNQNFRRAFFYGMGVALVAFAVYIWKRESDEEKKNSTGESEQEEKE